ncbi:flavin reductase family protein [Streptomyces sp. NPDC017082]|uniref:flavin reductase family protein n=1 Tax=Streptomyces sp. NPDC017082 TaxID=3364974 RepID=UPI0037B7105C
MNNNGTGRAALADSAAADLDPARLRDVFGTFATGVVAVTAFDDGRPTGLAANSFTSVSLDPPLVSFCAALTSSTWPRIRGARRLAVNVLAANQREVCERFAAKGGDKAAGLDWFSSPGGAPLVAGSLTWLECSVEHEYPAGDHLVVIARVRQAGGPFAGSPLLFFRSQYGRWAPAPG